MRRFAVALAVAGLVGSAAWACGSDDPTDPDDNGTVREVHLTLSAFTPGNITIAAGTTVRWISDTSEDHTITPENTNQPGVWQRRVITSSGERFEHTFTVSGQTYRYRCEPHSSSFTQGMVGTITVQ
jgi:plastocyanin